MKILGISGSLRHGSYNTSLLRTVARLFPDDVEFEIWGGLKEVPTPSSSRRRSTTRPSRVS
jgi:chromate reductase, NAD(P)H dehydrogenase (quinone)